MKITVQFLIYRSKTLSCATRNLFTHKGHGVRTNLQYSLRICSNPTGSTQSNIDNQIIFKRIYVFPYIRAASLINRLKFIHTAATGFALPASVVMHYTGVFPQAFQLAFAFGLLGSIPLYTLGILSNRLVGAIYVNENEDTAKVSYLNFWGKRTDIICNSNDFVPFSDSSCDNNFYLSLERYSSDERLYITIKYGNVLDKEHFDRLFFKHLK